VRVIAEELNMNRETVRQIVKESNNYYKNTAGMTKLKIVKEDLGMRKFSAKLVHRILAHDQKQRRFHISSYLLRNAHMFGRVITDDETWCF
jgi:orotate phosphoribosyltransferase-like protein